MEDQPQVPNCHSCGDRVGVYERVWFQRHDGAIEPSSLLNLHRAGLDPFAVTLWHRDCLPAERAP